MVKVSVNRKLTAILYADVVGYSRLTEADELGTHQRVMDFLDYANKTINQSEGRVLRYAGDAILAEFHSIVACVETAVQIQQELLHRNQALPENRQVQIRMGVNLGEVIEDRGEIYGDGVNIAARLESLAPPGGICTTAQVIEQVKGKLKGERQVTFGVAGKHRLKNIASLVDVRCWPPENARPLWQKALLRRWWLAPVLILCFLGLSLSFGLFHQEDSLSSLSGSRIAIVPFENVTEDPDEAYFSAGLTHDVNTLLAKFSSLVVLAPSTMKSFKANPDCATIREELKVDYILGGTVQRSGNRIHVTTTLTEAKSCRQLDAPGPFDQDMSVDNILDIQLGIA